MIRFLIAHMILQKIKKTKMQVYYRTHIERKITEYEVFDDESDEECPIKEAI